MTPERAAEWLSMLCAKVSHLEPAISGFESLKTYDIVHALALVKSIPAQMLVRIKYAGEESHTETYEDQLCAAVERGMMRHVEQLVAPQRWRVPRPGFLRDMCRLALIEHVNPKLCWRCDGRGGWVNRKNLKVQCEVCSGTGEGTYSDRARARVMRVHEASWRHHWRDRYRALQGVIDVHEGVGLGGMTKRITG